MLNTEIQTDENGFFYYENPPDNFTQAKAEDFYNKVEVQDEEGNFLKFKLVLKEDHAFLVHSFHYPVYWANRIKKDFDVSKLDPWFEDNRVYIWENDL